MKNNRWLRLLCLALCLLLFVSCGKDQKREEDPPEDGEQASLLTIAEGSTDYIVVRPELCDTDLTDAAATLRTALIDATGAALDIKTDIVLRGEEIPVDTPEILVGKTNRPESAQVLQTLGENEYSICVVGQRIVIIGQSDAATVAAVKVFINEILCYNQDTDTYGISSLKLAKDYALKRTYEKEVIDVDQSMIELLALSVTEGGVPLDRASIFARFADYKAMGVTCVRIDMYWGSANGKLTMQDATKYHLEAAREYGLKLKLIINPGGSGQTAQDSKLMDASGRYALNAVSPWYADAESYTEQHIRERLKAVLDAGYEDVIGGIIAGLGPAGEPLYPPAWTQGSGSEEVMWCYADNAQADFRAEMEKKYGDIDSANTAWGKDYGSFSEITVPKEGEVKGQMWRDVLEWYRDSKREFMAMQVRTFRAVMEEYEISHIPLILYLPGADYTEAQWESCVASGSTIPGIQFMCDNEFTVQLADEMGCILQYTGITGTAGLKLLRDYMFENGYADIPVMGENAGGSEPAAQAALLYDIITQYKLWGIDYTHSHWLYRSDGVTPSAMHTPFAQIVPKLASYLETVDITVPSPVKENVASPEGDVLAFEISFDKPAQEAFAFAFANILTTDFEVKNGDTLEYDVYLSDDMAGLGAIDGIFDGNKTMRDSFGMTDSTGLRVHPNADLSDVATGKWYHRVIMLGNSASDGCVLNTIQLAAHPEGTDGAFTQRDVTIYYDNIVIMRDGEVEEIIFESDGDVTLGKSAQNRYATGIVTITDADSVP